MAKSDNEVPSVGELRGTPGRYRPIELTTVDEQARRSARRANILAGVALAASAIGTTTLGWFTWVVGL